MRWGKWMLTAVTFSLLIGANGMSAASPTYTVKGNDTMWNIAQKNGVSLNTLIQANPNVANPNRIWPGMKLLIPVPSPVVKKPTTASSTPTPVVAVTTKPTPKPSTASTPMPVVNSTPTAKPLSTAKPTTVTTTATSVKATPTPATTASGSAVYADQVVGLVNQARAQVGLPPLSKDTRLAAMALDKAKDMDVNQYFDHISPTYGSPFDMMKAYGIAFTWAGENIAKGQRSPQEVMDAWMNSPGHRANILQSNFTKIGVSYYNGHWVQEFIAN